LVGQVILPKCCFFIITITLPLAIIS
jgi:hypothetical protein